MFVITMPLTPFKGRSEVFKEVLHIVASKENLELQVVKSFEKRLLQYVLQRLEKRKETIFCMLHNNPPSTKDKNHAHVHLRS